MKNLEEKKKFNELLPIKTGDQLNIYFHVSENSGVGYYRQYLPAFKLKESGLANVLISDFRWGLGDHVEPNMNALFDLMNWADIAVVGRLDDGNFYARWGGIREFFNIPIVLDTDDNVRFVRPHNPGYLGYHPNSEALTWNKYGVAKVFDALTVSTQDLKDFHSKENPKIYLLPNNLDMKEWNSHPQKVFDDGFVRVGFIASAAHTEGIQIIKKALLELMQKYPQVKFLITHVYQHLFFDFPEEIRKRIEPIPWMSLEQWPKGLKSIGLDIGLAPLADNMFNRAKSNLRWMEYSACGIPTIASPVKPYLCIQDNKDGIMAKESHDWFLAMEKLVVDKELRHNIGRAAYERVNTEFNVDNNLALWVNAYREVHEKFHNYFGSKKRFVALGKGKYRSIKS